MKLTKSLDIAFMILLQLAAKERKSNAKALSLILHFPVNHISKIIQTLSRGGYIRTRRGKGGGIELAKPPQKINLKDVIHSVEGPLFLMECTRHRDICPFSSKCLLRLKIKEVQETMMRIFERTTIADLIPGHSL